MTDKDTADAKKVAFKTELLLKIGLAVGLANAFGPRVHMIRPAAKRGGAHRIMCADGGWIEIDSEGRRVRTWGPGKTAQDLAGQIAADESGEAWTVDHLDPEAVAAAPGAARRATPVLSDERLKTLADGWRARGFDDVEMDDCGVWVALENGSRLYDVGDRVTLHGPVTDEAIFALAKKSADEWDSKLKLFGTWTDRDRQRLWLESMRQGVTMLDYEPSADLIARWEAERDASGASAGEALRPDDFPAPTSTGPTPSITGSADEPEPETPADEPDLSAFDRQSASLDRRLAELEQRQRMTIKERTDALQRTEHLDQRAAQARAFEELEQLRQAEARIAEAREILDRARTLAVEKGLDYESAVAVAKAEHLAERDHSYQPNARMRR